MSRQSSIESRVIEYFTTAPEDAVKAVFGIVAGIYKSRFRAAAPKKKSRKTAAAAESNEASS